MTLFGRRDKRAASSVSSFKKIWAKYRDAIEAEIQSKALEIQTPISDVFRICGQDAQTLLLAPSQAAVKAHHTQVLRVLQALSRRGIPGAALLEPNVREFGILAIAQHTSSYLKMIRPIITRAAASIGGTPENALPPLNWRRGPSSTRSGPISECDTESDIVDRPEFSDADDASIVSVERSIDEEMWSSAESSYANLDVAQEAVSSMSKLTSLPEESTLSIPLENGGRSYTEAYIEGSQNSSSDTLPSDETPSSPLLKVPTGGEGDCEDRLQARDRVSESKIDPKSSTSNRDAHEEDGLLADKTSMVKDKVIVVEAEKLGISREGVGSGEQQEQLYEEETAAPKLRAKAKADIHDGEREQGSDALASEAFDAPNHANQNQNTTETQLISDGKFGPVRIAGNVKLINEDMGYSLPTGEKTSVHTKDNSHRDMVTLKLNDDGEILNEEYIQEKSLIVDEKQVDEKSNPQPGPLHAQPSGAKNDALAEGLDIADMKMNNNYTFDSEINEKSVNPRDFIYEESEAKSVKESHSDYTTDDPTLKSSQPVSKGAREHNYPFDSESNSKAMAVSDNVTRENDELKPKTKPEYDSVLGEESIAQEKETPDEDLRSGSGSPPGLKHDMQVSYLPKPEHEAKEPEVVDDPVIQHESGTMKFNGISEAAQLHKVENEASGKGHVHHHTPEIVPVSHSNEPPRGKNEVDLIKKKRKSGGLCACLSPASTLD